MKGRFKTQLGWRIFILIGCPLLAGGFAYLLITLLNKEDPQMGILFFMVPVCLIMIALMLYGIGDAIVGYYEIDNTTVTHRTIFGKKVVPFTDIEGVHVDQNYIRLVPKTDKLGIDISRYIEKRHEVIEWAYENFKDIDIEATEEEDIKVLKEVTQDVPAADHDAQLEKAKKIARYLNWLGYGAGLWAFAYPRPYSYAVVATMIVPIITIIAIWKFKGFLRYDGSEKSRYPIMVNSLVVSISGLGIRAFMDFDVIDYGNLWTEAGTITVVIVTFLILTSKQITLKTWKSGFIALTYAALFYIYSISSLKVVNCRFDSSDPEIFEAQVLAKERSSGKTTSYYLDLSPWGPRTEHEKVPVGSHGFERANVGDTVEVYLYPGRFKASWFQVGIE